MFVLRRFLGPNHLYLLRLLSTDRLDQYEHGRQGTGYQKLRVKEDLQGGPLGTILPRALGALYCPVDNEFYDAYLLRYPKGSYIPRHVDEAGVFGKVHHRLNALVTEGAEGGLLTVDDHPVTLKTGDALLFRPDAHPHAVSEVLEGERLVLSIGCWL